MYREGDSKKKRRRRRRKEEEKATFVSRARQIECGHGRDQVYVILRRDDSSLSLSRCCAYAGLQLQDPKLNLILHSHKRPEKQWSPGGMYCSLYENFPFFNRDLCR